MVEQKKVTPIEPNRARMADGGTNGRTDQVNPMFIPRINSCKAGANKKVEPVTAKMASGN